MYPKNLKDIQNPAVRSRIDIERRIVTSLMEKVPGLPAHVLQMRPIEKN